MQEYEVLYSWSSENPEDLGLKGGTTIFVLDKKDHGWWLGMSTTVPPKKGYFPKSYVRPKNVADQTEEEKIAEKRFSAALGFKTEAYRRQFSMQTCEAFDALVESGVAVEMKNDTAVKGEKIQENSRVEMTISAMIWDGSSSQTQLFSEGILKFTLGKNQVTAGLEEALLRLHVNHEADIICAPLMAYGDAGQPPIVPPDAHIVYTVKINSTSLDESECNKNVEGDTLLLNTGISQRVHSSASNSALGQKSKAVVLVTDEKKKDGTEISDEMLAKAAEGMGLS